MTASSKKEPIPVDTCHLPTRSGFRHELSKFHADRRKPAVVTALAAVSFRVARPSAIRSFAVYLFGLAFSNALRRKQRTALTVVGTVVAIVVFGLLHTIDDTGAGRSRLG
jgi:hypothetical protein